MHVGILKCAGFLGLLRVKSRYHELQQVSKRSNSAHGQTAQAQTVFPQPNISLHCGGTFSMQYGTETSDWAERGARAPLKSSTKTSLKP